MHTALWHPLPKPVCVKGLVSFFPLGLSDQGLLIKEFCLCDSCDQLSLQSVSSYVLSLASWSATSLGRGFTCKMWCVAFH
jgi:hypothetical protein